MQLFFSHFYSSPKCRELHFVAKERGAQLDEGRAETRVGFRILPGHPASPGKTCGFGGLALDVCFSDVQGLEGGEVGGRTEKCPLGKCSEI